MDKIHGTLESEVLSFKEEKERLKKDKHRLQPKNKEPPDGDWLSAMKSGTEFLVRNKVGLTPRWLVVEWIHGGLHFTGNVLLIPAKTPNDVKQWMWVEPMSFCNEHEFRGIIEEEKADD